MAVASFISTHACGPPATIALVVAGLALFDSADAGPVPTVFVAVTAHWYVLPFVRLETVMGLPGPLAEPGTPPVGDVHDASYVEAGMPPSSLGTRNDTTRDPGSGCAVTFSGGPGSVGTSSPYFDRNA